MHVPGDKAAFDERRNTSRTFQPQPNALKNCLEAMARFRQEHPALAQWIADGHPHLTEEEHVRRFGEPYTGHRARR